MGHLAIKQAILCVHHGRDDDDGVYWAIGRPNADGAIAWSDGTHSGYKTKGGVGLLEKDGKVYCAFGDANADGQLRTLIFTPSATGGSWSEMSGMGINKTYGTPSLINYRDNLWCFYHSYTNEALFYCRTTDQVNWGEPQQILAIPGAIEPPGVLVIDDYITLTYTETGYKYENYIFYNCLDPHTWTWDMSRSLLNNKTKNLMQTRSKPTLAAFDGDIYFAHAGGNSDNSLWTALLDGAGGILSVSEGDIRAATYETLCGPTLLPFNGKLYLFYRSTEDESWILMAEWDKKDPWTDSAWINERRVGNGNGSQQSEFEVGVAAYSYDDGQ